MSTNKATSRPAPLVVKPRPIPQDDGITHINIGSKAATELGRELAHFTHKPFVHPEHGPFDTMEGYWQWVKSKDRPDELRYMTGHNAKKFGGTIEREYIEDFQELILEGNYCKIVQNPELMHLLLDSTLPFDHYYLFDDKVDSPVRPRGHEWLVASFDTLRTMLRDGDKPKGLAVRGKT